MTDSVLSTNISPQNSQISLSEDTKDNASQEREELEWKFKIIKKSYPLINVPKFDSNSDIEIMKKTYEDVKKLIQTEPENLSLYDKLPFLRTLSLNFEATKATDGFMYLAGTYDENNIPYDCVKFRLPCISRYKKKKGMFSCLIKRDADILYDIHIPVKVKNMRLIIREYKNSGNDHKDTVVYDGESLQNKNGDIIFDNPLLLTSIPFQQIFIEYSVDENRYKLSWDDKLYHPILTVSLVCNDYRMLRLNQTIIPVLERCGLFLEKANDHVYDIVKK